MRYCIREITTSLICEQSKFTLKHTMEPLYIGKAMNRHLSRDEDYFKVLQVFAVCLHMNVHFHPGGLAQAVIDMTSFP